MHFSLYNKNFVVMKRDLRPVRKIDKKGKGSQVVEGAKEVIYFHNLPPIFHGVRVRTNQIRWREEGGGEKEKAHKKERKKRVHYIYAWEEIEVDQRGKKRKEKTKRGD